MAWKVTLTDANGDDKSILLDDLTEDDFVNATKDYPDITWMRLYMSPGTHPGAYYKLLCACAVRLEVPVPEAPKNIRQSIELLEHIESVDDDLPKAFDEGGLPLEGTGDGPETTI